jgi:flagellar assembly factor FliW
MNTLELAEFDQPAVLSNDVVLLPYGLLGFERVKNYSLLANVDEAPFQWLRILEDARHAFLVLPGTSIICDYRPELEEEDIEFLELDATSDKLVLNIIALRNTGPATVNLKGPIVINRGTWIGKQIVPKNAGQFSVRHPLPIA